MQANLIDVVDFLTYIFDNGLKGCPVGYSAMNTARSALSTFLQIDGVDAGKHPVVKRFMRGVFNQRPALPKYSYTWDLGILLKYIEDLPSAGLSLKMLSMKLYTLLVILTGQRSQAISLFDINNMFVEDDKIIFRVFEPMKTSGPKSHNGEFMYKAFVDKNLCVVTCVNEYLEKVKDLRGDVTSLFVSYIKPHGRISRDALRRWLKVMMKNAGIDITFSSHSARGAATAFAAKANVSIDIILKTAGWSNENTFNKFYNLPIRQCMGDEILLAYKQ